MSRTALLAFRSIAALLLLSLSACSEPGPVILGVEGGRDPVLAGGERQFTAQVMHPQDLRTHVEWAVDGGALSAAAGSEVVWRAAATPGLYWVTVRASDPRGAAMTSQVAVQVTNRLTLPAGSVVHIGFPPDANEADVRALRLSVVDPVLVHGYVVVAAGTEAAGELRRHGEGWRLSITRLLLEDGDTLPLYFQPQILPGDTLLAGTIFSTTTAETHVFAGPVTE